jgi:hypothetical protein
MTHNHHHSSSSKLHLRNAQRQSASLRALAPLLCAACVALSGSASAQELNAPGHLVFGAERLFGFYLDKQNFDFGPVERNVDTTVVGIGWSMNNDGALLTIPRLGIDYFIDEHLTLGGSLGIASVSVDNSDVLGILLAARVGYALRLTHAVSFWPRGGLTFASAGGDDDVNVFAVTIEGMFTLAPSDGWAFLAGPLLDLGFTGSAGDDGDHTEILFGIMFGLTGWLEV